GPRRSRSTSPSAELLSDPGQGLRQKGAGLYPRLLRLAFRNSTGFGPRQESGHEVCVPVRLDGGPDPAHEVEVVMQVVDGIEPRTEDLVAAIEMAQVSPRVIAARVATALRVERRQ